MPPQVETLQPVWDADAGRALISGVLRRIGESTTLEVGFEFRDITGLDLTERHGSWKATPPVSREIEGRFSRELTGLNPGHAYEVRAIVKHPLLTLYGAELMLRVP